MKNNQTPPGSTRISEKSPAETARSALVHLAGVQSCEPRSIGADPPFDSWNVVSATRPMDDDGNGEGQDVVTQTRDDVVGLIPVAIIEDHVMVSEALKMALGAQPDIEVVGIASTLQEGVAFVMRVRPVVVVLDYNLPDGDAPTGIGAIRAASPGTAILVLSDVSDYHTVVRTLEAGADGYLLKDQTMEELVEAVRSVCNGGRPLAPRLVSALVSRLARTTTPAQQLSRREIEVLRLLAQGLSTVELSTQMKLSINTVRNHVQKAIRRLGAHSKLEAVAIAQREGIIGVASITTAS
jgi:DNA-binding NarL/FixJ family response regulator